METRRSGWRPFKVAACVSRLRFRTLTHVVTGQGLSEAAVQDAIRLSHDKYCSVWHTLRPDLVIENPVELVEG